MKREISSSDHFAILLKTEDDISWQRQAESIRTPSFVNYKISAPDDKMEIKKIIWDLGNGNKHKSITNRKQNLYEYNMECKYKKSHDLTLSVCASVYTDHCIFITKPVNIRTINEEIKQHYVEPEDFKRQILQYYDTNVFSDEVADSVYKIANRLAFAPNFINYTYREEMVGDAVIRMMEALTKQQFDPEKGNPFSYFTKIAFHAFCNRIKKEKKMRDALANYQETVYNEMINDGIIPHPRTEAHHHDDSYFNEDT